ncbi:IgGFc-binding protein-like [Cygnus olor]|uniref:IgGFc-binding protein-like n=1 Tax=Cygnus olor TaxID=8869 RepID=UPI001ADE7659|nr:IgGFc-binding protein-like [Cygnus olor]
MGHVRTFDRLHHDFSGSCVYLLAGLCPGTQGPEPFRVLVRGGLGGITGAEVLVRRTRVELEPGQVTVNGIPTLLPHVAKASAVTLEPRGWEVEVRTPRGLRVAFDGHHGRVSIRVPGAYSGHLCGLCGDFDGDPRNDLAPAGGWRVRDTSGCRDAAGCGDVGGKGQQDVGRECGVLLNKEGPFRLCHEAVHPETYFRDCVADRCHREGVCRVLAAYVAACQEAGRKVLEWRSKGFCSPQCPTGTRYAICAPGCTPGCREGCVSPDDSHGDTQRCSAEPVAAPATVGTPGTCRAVGTQHYLSFDGVAMAVADNCSYVVARSCGPPGAHPAFDVTVTDPPRGGPGPRSVTVTVHQHRFVLRGGHPGMVEVDGSKASLPFCLQGQAVCLAPRGATTLLVADFGLRVTAGPGAAVAVTVSPSFRNVTCGLCGNFDGHPYNDHLHQATTATCHRPCPGPTCPPCRQPPKKAFVHTELCGVLRDPQGPFGGCHAAVHPRVFFDVCLWELCEAPEDKEVLSEVLGAYEAACRQAKVRVGPWRAPSVCRELGTAGTRGGRWPRVFWVVILGRFLCGTPPWP